MLTAKVIQLPVAKRNGRGNGQASQNIDGIKYFTELEIKLIRRTIRNRAEADLNQNKVTAVREWMALDLITCAGIRVAEAANVRCGDFRFGHGRNELFVRFGKGSKSRTIQIPKSLKKHVTQFINWKSDLDESTDHDDYLFIGQRGPWTSQAIQQAVKKYLKILGIYEPGKSVHALRHSYAVQLYARQHDLRAVQKQLGHSSIQTTQVYADVTPEDIQRQLKGIWN